MLYMRFMNPLKTICLDQLDNPTKTGQHVIGQLFQLGLNAVIENVNNPRHLFQYCIFAILKGENYFPPVQGLVLEVELRKQQPHAESGTSRSCGTCELTVPAGCPVRPFPPKTEESGRQWGLARDKQPRDKQQGDRRYSSDL